MIEYISQYLVHKYTYDLICKDQTTGKTTNQDNQQLWCDENRCHHCDKCHLLIFTPHLFKAAFSFCQCCFQFLDFGPQGLLSLLGTAKCHGLKFGKKQSNWIRSKTLGFLPHGVWNFICSLVFNCGSPAHQTTTPAASLLHFILMCCSPLILDKKKTA